MKKLLTLVLPLFLYTFTFSQELIVKSGSKGFYLEHKVAPKEGLFPIGRKYNVHPRHIANFNGIDFNKGLAIGQQINVPLTDTNFKQTVNKGIPVYYNVTEKESLANISVKSKAPINNLRSWNDIKVDNISPGTKLIIGFLITNEMQDRVVTIIPKTVVAEESVSNVKKSEELKKQTDEPKKDIAKNEPVVVEESVSNVKKSEELKKQTEEPKKDIPKTERAVTEESVSNVKKGEEVKKQTEPVVKQPETINDDGTGYFKSNFYQQVKTSPQKKEQTVTSSIFKTTSGWQDGKYYLLINGVEPGTIVKLTNPSNSKIVYAKVLYAMDKIRENQGVDIRISDAAASTLAVTETDKFILKVNY
jgi:LysM repeat protein